ncbi:MAG: type IV pilus assembly protein PilM [Candidatus Moranbacteria bacterium]|nr:type IV pilus assembly protein PilM [Candidatus Moranbacteria bacterium]
MSLFSKKPDYFLGIDFGARSIKAVELEFIKNKSRLVNYGWVNLDGTQEAIDLTSSAESERLQAALASLLQSFKPKSNSVTVSIPSFNGLVLMVDFPIMSEIELAEAIKLESRKYIPAPMEDVNISWEIVKNAQPVKPGMMKVVLVAAPKSEVNYYNNLFLGAGMSVDALELEPFALVRSLIGKDKGKFIIVDIGAKTTSLSLIEGGAVYVNRSLNVGGVNITNAISSSLQIPFTEALQLKESGENFFAGGRNINFDSIKYIAGEIKRIVNSRNGDTLDAVILCGGTARLTGIDGVLSQMTGLRVIIGNPWSHVTYDSSVAQNLEQSTGPAFAVAVGLAERGIEELKSQ